MEANKTADPIAGLLLCMPEVHNEDFDPPVTT